MRDLIHLMIFALCAVFLLALEKDNSSGWMILAGMTMVLSLRIVGRRYVPVWTKQARRLVRS